MIDSGDTRGLRAILALLCCVCVAIPFFSVSFPPISDLPQQVAQIRLFLEAIHHPDGPYRIQWFTPHSLSYAVLGVAWALFSPADVGRIAMLAIGMLWTVAAHLLAARRNRPAAGAVLASLIVFNHVVYWGFYSFAIGWPAFVLWFLLTTRPAAQRSRWTEAMLFLGAALLLYVSHALWFAAGLVWFAVSGAALRVPLKTMALRGLGLAPVLFAAAVWYPHLSASGFVSPTVWASTPIARLSFSWLADAVFGGIRGPAEYVVFGVLVGWVALSAWQRRETLSTSVDRACLLAAGLFGILALLLPDLYENTMEFAARWVPAAMIFLLMSVPAPIFKPALQRSAALALLAVFCLTTALAWTRFERTELAGLQDCLGALPAGPRVIGLDFVQDSAVIKGRPFLQTFAYAQVLRGGQLNMSFAQYAPSLVVYKDRRRVPWTTELQWFPERAKPSDFQYFDYAIVNASDSVHATFAAQPYLAPVTRDGPWRLYRMTGATE